MSGARKPRVVLLTSPAVYGAIIINTLAEHADVDLVGVGLTNRAYKGKGLLATIRTSIKRTGWRYTAYNALVANVAWTLLRLRGRPKGLASIEKTNVWPIDDVNSETTVNHVKDLQPDFVVSFYFNQWIGPELRGVPTIDCINVHPSLLPNLRGPDPAFRTIERQLSSGGITIHRVADDFDAGAIIAQRSIDADPSCSVFSLYCDWAKLGTDFLCEWLANRQTDVIDSSDEPGDYTTFPSPLEVGRFLKAGHRLISIGELRRQLRKIA